MKVPLYKLGLVTHFSGVAYQKLPVAFMEMDLQLCLRFCRALKNPHCNGLATHDIAATTC